MTSSPSSLVWEQVVVDSSDPARLARWWADALGWVVVSSDDDEPEIRPTPDTLPGLLFVSVPEAKTAKNRLHLDFRPSPVDGQSREATQADEVARLESLGAVRAQVGQDDSDVSWVVLADPEGNEFCVL
ncbi:MULTISPECIES: VOC family protein [unclassified Frigoribacterium]|uniref:VOC family protein n=1 Tax=unclassified Frigoribacterium TaxID=2627005 RepID=UPI0006F788CF|nr:MULTISPECIES: VOC family protein [unclassified Frigoribacterium]KQO45398.1 glyoxalase [Frigoribacterium sp. Leaf254]KQT37100.1 glyoxalase [Frigoribacterium sp. Leaf415]